MVWKKGESGNPNGMRREQPFRNALDRAIAQDDGKRIRKAAEQLLSQAAKGTPWALNMLADRLDGKADQSVTIIRKAEEMTDDDLLRIAAASGARVASEKEREEKSSKVH